MKELRYVRVASIGEIGPGESKRVYPEPGEYIVLCNVGGSYYAIRDACSHDGGILGFGDLQGDLIKCPRHDAEFNVTTGEVVSPPAVRPVQTYPVRVRGEDVEVGLQG